MSNPDKIAHFKKNFKPCPSGRHKTHDECIAYRMFAGCKVDPKFCCACRKIESGTWGNDTSLLIFCPNGVYAQKHDNGNSVYLGQQILKPHKKSKSTQKVRCNGCLCASAGG